MKFNPVMIQKALCHLATAISYLGTSISAGPGDIEEYNEILRARKAIADSSKADGRRPDPEPERTNDRQEHDFRSDSDGGAQECQDRRQRRARHAARPSDDGSRPATSAAGLPGKPMRQARMDSFVVEWCKAAKAKETRSSGGFSKGMGCTFGGVEHVVRAVYDNGVARVSRKATQYHRLVPVNELEGLFPKDSGYRWASPPAPGSRIEVCFGTKDSDTATSFRTASVSSVHGQTLDVSYPDNGTTSSVLVRHARPPRGK